MLLISSYNQLTAVEPTLDLGALRDVRNDLEKLLDNIFFKLHGFGYMKQCHTNIWDLASRNLFIVVSLG